MAVMFWLSNPHIPAAPPLGEDTDWCIMIIVMEFLYLLVVLRKSFKTKFNVCTSVMASNINKGQRQLDQFGLFGMMKHVVTTQNHHSAIMG